MGAAVSLITGFLGGLMGGLLGLGGGVLMIPIMTWLTKVTQHQAHGTSLVAIVFTALIGAGTYIMHGNADWRAALLIAVSAVFTARLGAIFAHSLPEKKLKKAFGVFLSVAAAMLLMKIYLPRTGFELGSWGSAGMFLMIGCVTGFVSGMMGVGGGAAMVPLLVILGNMGQHLAQGTSLLAMVPASMSGAITHYRLGNVRINIVWGLTIGAIIGGYLGATAARAFSELYLRLVFAFICFWMGIRYMRS
jgi:uncharacterized protein